MATNKSLYDPVPTYRKFVDNQVLTDDQLNAVLDHLNYQDQLSRVLLSGVGIVCGLHLSLNTNGETSIEITSGAAVTTDGNLLKVGETTFKGFKRFRDDNVKYSRFLQDGESTMPLWELETDTDPSDVHTLENFESEVGFPLEEAIAVLYLEDYLKEQEDCSPVDCDTQGREVVNTIRVLLVSPGNAEKIAQGDSILSDLLSEEGEPLVNTLSPIYTPRVVLNKANTDSYEKFRKAYNVQFSSLANRIIQLGNLGLFHDILEEQDVNPDNVLGSLSGTFFNTQYLYDFYKDLVTAYNELRDLLKKYYAICCPDPDAFPKHVLLGSLVKSETPWRHEFYPSPILNHPNSLNSLKSAFKRLLLMIKDFRTERKDRVQITPSRNGHFRIGEQAIPFYYDLENSEDPLTFLENWKEEDIDLVPNYYGYDYPESDFDPLDVCLDDHDFYRIEGHVGHHVMDVHEELQDIQEEKGLAFDIKPVAIGEYPDEETIDYDKYRVYFEDLQVVLQAWNEEQECLMESASKFLSGFSLAEPGRHVNYTIENNGDSDVNSVSTGMPLITAYRKKKEQPSYTAYRTKAKENYVLKGITEEQGTLGGTMHEHNTIVSNYNRGEIIYNTGKAVEGFVEDWEIDIKEAAVNIPVELLGHLKETEDHKLTDIEDFTEENLKKYIDALKAQCKQAQTSKKRFQRLSGLKEYTAAQPWIEQYEFILNRIISSCCLIKKVEVLYEKILERKQEVLKQRVLDNFVDRHPGAEHKAGVPDGGTFIVLYLSRRQEPEGRTLRAELESDRRGIVAMSTSSLANRKQQLPHGTVIGDLCLPYICCSETPSTTFVFPEQLATLRLPVGHVCVGEDDEVDPVRMDVTPADGEIKAYIQERELSGVIIRNENGLFFDPNQVSSDDYDKVIRFKVNGQPVEPILQIYRKPEPGFTYDDEITFREENTIAVVTFENISEPFDELTFEWDFAGEVVKDENSVVFKHTFNVEPGENYDFQVRLKAFNGSCEETFTESVNIDVPDIEEPVEDCEEVTAATIRNTRNIMDRLFQANPDILSEVQPSYQDEVQPVYEKILENTEEAFSGGMDEEVFAFIQNAHFAIQEMIGTYNTDTEREFSLLVYYELILLYFYLQACREEDIEVHAQISDVAGGWADFTDRAREEFPEALEALIGSNDIHEKLVIIRKRMNQRFDEEIADIVDDLISKLNEVSG
ncbi:hypothetical protein LQ318_09285 [Aliifodinibius salicampi]|uniref:PKD domain-containing protein n=1 Tax=Fodinibius salicampi TaxID=1920655 RepID=A0ABT3PZ15_9BACT|nr:hypothetical protein [Fodinibius salicampi]MCW9713095.1 hypothetical protein [Fodinibius salicampi]